MKMMKQRTVKAAAYLNSRNVAVLQRGSPKEAWRPIYEFQKKMKMANAKLVAWKMAVFFLNRKGYEAEGFTGSFGCVLHHVAQRDGKHFADTKPDVCWQLPLRRSFETREYGEREYSVTVIGEYERLAWGDGGDDFDWYCTSNSDAHVGTQSRFTSQTSTNLNC